jgi:hypothetical protein
MTTLIPKYRQGLTGSLNRPIDEKIGEWISVLDFGADPTGVLDSTAAFNLATQATTAWSSALTYNIIIPSGVYKLNGTVYVRKGQTIWGQGQGTNLVCSGNTTSETFYLGFGNVGGVPAQDPGGNPVAIGSFWSVGGAANSGVIRSGTSGYLIRDVFLTSPGVGLDLSGTSDGLITNVQIDQALTGILLDGGQNIVISNFDIYLANFGIRMGGGTRDVQFSNGIIEYSAYQSVQFTGSETKSINFSNVSFVMNEQFATFQGYVFLSASNLEVLFTGCSFRNMYNSAITYSNGTTLTISFKGCIFDGTRSTSAYTQSTTAYALNAAYGTYNFDGCEFRNLYNQIITVNNNLTALNIKGGEVINCPATRLNLVTTQRTPNISIKNVTGFAHQVSNATHQYVVLPFWNGSTIWKVSVKGNPAASSSLEYSAAEEGAYSVAYQFAGSGNMYVDKALLWATPNRAVPGLLGAVVCFGNVPGGAATSATYATTGLICISVATASAENFQWYAETSN